MLQFQPVYKVRLGQAAAPAPAPAATSPTGATPAPAPAIPIAPAPAPVVTTTAYTGVPGFIETVAVLSIAVAAAYTGIKAGMSKDAKKVQRAAGWVGGVGLALLGALYLGSKTGLTRAIALPQIQVVPA